MYLTHESFTPEHEKTAFAMLLDETHVLSERLLEHIEDLYEHFPSLELHRALHKMREVSQALPE